MEQPRELSVSWEKSRSVNESRRPDSSLVSRGLPAPERIIPGPGIGDSTVVVRVEDHCVLQQAGSPQTVRDVSEALVHPGHEAAAPPSGRVDDVTAELLVSSCRQQRVVGGQVGEQQEEGGGGEGGEVGLHHSDSLSVEQVCGVAGVVPVRLVVAPEIEPAVPALLGEIVLPAAQHAEEVMEAPVERVKAGLAVTEVPLGEPTVRQTNMLLCYHILNIKYH